MKKFEHKLRVAVIGTGSMGQNHIRVYSQMENVQLVAVVDTNRQILKKIANTYNVHSYFDYRVLLEKESLNIISLVVPTRLHHDIARDIINKGINVLIEKPLAPTRKECQGIIELAKKKKIILGVGHIERFNPVISELKKHLHDGKLGKVFQMTVRRIGPYPQRITDVGVCLDLVTHDIDVLYYLTGSEVKSVSTEASYVVDKNKEDLSVSLLRFRNGMIGIMMENWLSPTKVRDIMVHGEKGMLLADMLTQDLYFYENNYTPSPWESLSVFRGMAEGNMTRYYVRRNEPLQLELKAFVDAVVNKKKFLISGEDGLRAVLFAEQLVKASKKNNL